MREGGGRCEPWWRQTEARKQLSVTLEEISVEARVQRWESGRRSEVEGYREVAESNAEIDGPRYDGTETGYPWVGV